MQEITTLVYDNEQLLSSRKLFERFLSQLDIKKLSNKGAVTGNREQSSEVQFVQIVKSTVHLSLSDLTVLK